MSEAVTTYDILCHAPDLPGALRAMSDRKLAEILDYLGEYHSGIPAQVATYATAEAADRWQGEQRDKSGAVGAGNA